MSILLVGLTMASAPVVAGEGCAALTTAKRAGEIVSVHDTASTPCPRSYVAPKLRFDPRVGVVRARTDLGAGEFLGRAWFPQARSVAPGDRVRIAATVGHVVVSRDATALQGARDGERFFVKADNGEVFVAPANGRRK